MSGLKVSWLKVPAAMLLAFMIMSGVTMPALAQAVPVMVWGYVTVDGTPMNGVLVSCNGAQYTTKNDASGHAGFYEFGPSINNGSSATISFSYNGKTASATITNNGDQINAPQVNIVTTATPTPQGNQGGNSNTGSSGSSTSTTTPTPTVTTSTTPPSTTPTQTPATPTPIQSPTASGTGDNTMIYIVIAVIAVLAIIGAGYVLLKKP